MVEASSESALTVRLGVLCAELQFALSRSDRHDLKSWGIETTNDFGTAMGRRVANVGKLLSAIAKRTAAEFQSAKFAYEVSHLDGHLDMRARALGESSASLLTRSAAAVSQLWTSLAKSPGDVAPKLLTAVVLSLVVSGGPDGDGGAPDLDLLFGGIGAHRSLLTHSILMGSALETGFLSLLRLVQIVHKNLPSVHDPLWDESIKHADRIIEGAVVGSGLGMAYHLFVDGTIDKAPFHGLGIYMPIEVHQALILVNSLGEAASLPVNGSLPRASELATAVSREDVQAEHKKFRLQRAQVLPVVAALITPEQAAIIRRYGAWMSALAVGEISPATPEQAHFKAVARLEAEPETDFELAWLAYMLAWLALVLTGSQPTWGKKLRDLVRERWG